MSIVTNRGQNNKYRITLRGYDEAGIEICPVWYGVASTTAGAVEKAIMDAERNNWSEMRVIAAQKKRALVDKLETLH